MKLITQLPGPLTIERESHGAKRWTTGTRRLSTSPTSERQSSWGGSRVAPQMEDHLLQTIQKNIPLLLGDYGGLKPTFSSGRD
jgi:hypothetical protein